MYDNETKTGVQIAADEDLIDLQYAGDIVLVFEMETVQVFLDELIKVILSFGVHFAPAKCKVVRLGVKSLDTPLIAEGQDEVVGYFAYHGSCSSSGCSVTHECCIIFCAPMGGDNSKLTYRNVVIQLTTKTQPIDSNDNAFWERFWTDISISVQDMFVLIPAAEIRALREESPNNLATLSYKAVEKLSRIAEASFPTAKDQQTALNCIRLLTRLFPYIFEDPEWRSFFWSALPLEPDSAVDDECVPLAHSLISALCDLLFCPDFTVHSIAKSGPEGPEDMHTIDSCEYIWQAGVGFAQNPVHNTAHDSNRTEILKLLLTCFSETMYMERDEAQQTQNKWVSFFTSTNNRHALPLFASLLNVVCAYDPVGFGVPYNHLMFSDSREPLVEVALQVLCIVLETELTASYPTHSSQGYRNLVGRMSSEAEEASSTTATSAGDGTIEMNLFANYMSRIHRDEDFAFILNGLTRLLNNPLQQTYLPGSTKKVQMHQELLVLFWRMCEINKKFMYYVLKSSQVLDLLVPILYHLNDARSDPARLGLVHVGVFILLLLSGERNFGVRLNKPYKNRAALDIPVFTGTHADVLIIVFHKLITTGHRRLQPLFDCLLTIIVNVSPYLKSMSMVTANKLLHLLEAFSQPWFLYSGQTHYQLVFLLLEVFNNIIQYQFDGNSNLVYTLIRKRQVFYHLANLPTDQSTIQRILKRRPTTLPNSDHSSPESSPTISAKSKSHSIKDNHDAQTTKEGARKKSQADIISPTSAVAPAGNRDVNGSAIDTPEVRFSQVLRDDVHSVSELSVFCALQPALAETPAIRSMTDRLLANAAGSTSGDFHSSDGATHPLEDALISHLSPSRRFRSLSDNSSPPKLTSYPHESGDGLHSVPLNHPGIAHSSLLGENPTSMATERVTDPPNSYTSLNSAQSVNHHSSKSSGINQTPGRSDENASKHEGVGHGAGWVPTSDWAASWKAKMPFQTIMRLLQVLVPQVEKICIDKGLTDETEIVKFLQNGTLVGLLPVPHPILIRKYQSNAGTAIWFRNYLWGVIYL
ncbi:hypothetical protein CLF_110457, partial [Clonorchis sinensis]